MPFYKFKGRDYETGSLVIGEEYAESRNSLAGKLHSRGVSPVNITRKGVRRNLTIFGVRSFAPKELALFAKQFSVMIRAGIPLVQSLSVLSSHQESGNLKAILAEVGSDVEHGASLADSLRKHPKMFNRLFLDMIAAGEVGGFLDVALKRLSIYTERAVKIRNQALTASVYPLIVMAVALVTGALTLIWVVPVFVSLFEEMDVPLPFLTRMVVMLSNWSSQFGIPLFFLLFAGGAALRSLRRQHKWRLHMDRIMLGTPLLGGVLQKIAVARFSLTLATLLKSGIPLLTALEITAASAGDCVFQNALTMVRREVQNGRSLFESMQEAGIFPAMVIRMIAVGEQSGELDQMLEHISTFYEEESEAAVQQLVTALEPTLVVVLGLLVGAIVISMYLPIFSLVGHFAR